MDDWKGYEGGRQVTEGRSERGLVNQGQVYHGAAQGGK